MQLIYTFIYIYAYNIDCLVQQSKIFEEQYYSPATSIFLDCNVHVRVPAHRMTDISVTMTCNYSVYTCQVLPTQALRCHACCDPAWQTQLYSTPAMIMRRR